MAKFQLNEALAAKVLTTIDAGLVRGLGEPTPGKMCVEAAVCYAMGLPHSDQPSCVSSAVRALKIKLNDSRWSTDEARTKGLRRLGVAQLGTEGIIDNKEFGKLVSVLVIQKYVPIALRAAAARANPEKAAKLEEVAVLCSLDPSIENAKKAKEIVAYSAACAYAYAYATDADAAAAAAAAAAYAAYAAASAAYSASAAYAAYTAAHAAATYAYAYVSVDAADAAASAAASAASAASASHAAYCRCCDSVLAEFGEDVVQILIILKAPGAEFLYLTESN